MAEEREAKHRQQQMKVMEERIGEKQAQVDKLESSMAGVERYLPVSELRLSRHFDQSVFARVSAVQDI